MSRTDLNHPIVLQTTIVERKPVSVEFTPQQMIGALHQRLLDHLHYRTGVLVSGDREWLEIDADGDLFHVEDFGSNRGGENKTPLSAAANEEFAETFKNLQMLQIQFKELEDQIKPL